MPILPQNQGDDPLLRIRTVDGEPQLFVRINGRDHVIGGVVSIDPQEASANSILTAKFEAAIGGWGDR